MDARLGFIHSNKECIMKKRSLHLWSICILVALAASCGSQPTSSQPTTSQANSSQPKPTPTLASMATPDCDKGFSRLAIGETITVIEAGHPNRVRATPHILNDNVIGQISAGMTGKIVDGPVCLDGIVFWKIESQSVPGGTGWTGEGNGTARWLEQYQP
jgi:hypothetical protein